MNGNSRTSNPSLNFDGYFDEDNIKAAEDAGTETNPKKCIKSANLFENGENIIHTFRGKCVVFFLATGMSAVTGGIRQNIFI